MIYSFDARGPFAPSFVSQNIKDWLGYEPREYLESADFWRRCVHPDEIAAVEAESGQLTAVEHDRLLRQVHTVMEKATASKFDIAAAISEALRRRPAREGNRAGQE